MARRRTYETSRRSTTQRATTRHLRRLLQTHRRIRKNSTACSSNRTTSAATNHITRPPPIQQSNSSICTETIIFVYPTPHVSSALINSDTHVNTRLGTAQHTKGSNVTRTHSELGTRPRPYKTNSNCTHTFTNCTHTFTNRNYNMSINTIPNNIIRGILTTIVPTNPTEYNAVLCLRRVCKQWERLITTLHYNTIHISFRNRRQRANHNHASEQVIGHNIIRKLLECPEFAHNIRHVYLDGQNIYSSSANVRLHCTQSFLGRLRSTIDDIYSIGEPTSISCFPQYAIEPTTPHTPPLSQRIWLERIVDGDRDAITALILSLLPQTTSIQMNNWSTTRWTPQPLELFATQSILRRLIDGHIGTPEDGDDSIGPPKTTYISKVGILTQLHTIIIRQTPGTLQGPYDILPWIQRTTIGTVVAEGTWNIPSLTHFKRVYPIQTLHLVNSAASAHSIRTLLSACRHITELIVRYHKNGIDYCPPRIRMFDTDDNPINAVRIKLQRLCLPINDQYMNNPVRLIELNALHHISILLYTTTFHNLSAAIPSQIRTITISIGRDHRKHISRTDISRTRNNLYTGLIALVNTRRNKHTANLHNIYIHFATDPPTPSRLRLRSTSSLRTLIKACTNAGINLTTIP